MWRGVFAVVYTFNRRELVAQCLEAIAAQTVPPERVVVVDNGSTDGTRAYLDERGLLANPLLDYVRLEQNSGAAGGLRAGISYAYEHGCEWVWVMDDDVIAQPDTLAGLKQAYETCFASPERVGFMVSRLIGPDGRPNNIPHIDERRDAVHNCADWAVLLHHGIVKVRIATMTSILLPRATLARCGAPRRDFFLWGEDTDYTLRVTDWRPGYFVGGSLAVHLRGVPGDLDVLNETAPARIDNFYYLYRNTTYLRRTYWPAHGFYLFLGKAALYLCRALVHRRHPLRRARAILFGTVAGLFFRPHDEPLGGDAVLADPTPAAQVVGRLASSH